ncbi:MAG: BMP family ABC transporter substrate-binding protein [Bacilli bacterium]|nr:BMP family ABC transporter substrate-binding protein [Bacilli bacterium]
MKNIRLLSLAALGLVSLAACSTNGGNGESSSVTPYDDAVKVGLICLHDSNSTYDANFINGLKEAVKNLGRKVIFEDNCLLTGVPEDNACYTAAKDLVGKGCEVIFADSFGHDSFMLQAAKEYPNVQFCHATGTKSTVNPLQLNFHNAFASIYEGRYLAGYAAGLKLFEQQADKGVAAADFPTEKVGYVGAFPYAEVKSGYTSWFLGLRQALTDNTVDASKVTMDVRFTSSWYDPEAEANAATALINDGAVLVSQHADSMGAPGVCEEKGIPNVTYNVETGDDCPKTYLAYSRINWAPYYEAVVNAVYNRKVGMGDGLFPTNWTGTLKTGSVEYNVNWDNLTKDSTRLDGYKTKFNNVLTSLKNGSRKVFDTSTFTVNGEAVTSYLADVIDDGTFTGETEVIATEGSTSFFNESYYRSAPYFDLNIDGINLKN